ncbi:MAG: NAD-dependent epimerase/dehydratase family protein [Candidatus Omnitrophica bacterium]|nr:NAD-dependent epimerase/dehydratase family protein [Candidatus Omnitrophota bacterium]
MASKQHILITGGAGMIGSNLAKQLAANGYRVSVADNLWRGKKENLIDGDRRPVIDMEKDFYEIDLAVSNRFDHILEGVDYVYHLADVVAGIGYVFNNQGALFRENLLINSNVIAAVRRNPIKGFIYVGTACSFPAELQSGVDVRPLREEDQYPASPESAYGWSKLMGEYEALLMEEEMNIPVSILSLHNVYGSPCDFGEEKSQVIPSLIRKAISYPEEPFDVWGSGSQGRAFVHVNDAVDALVLAMEKGLGKGLIQIGPDVCISIKEIAETIVEISGKDINIHYDTSRPEGDKGRCADFSKARKILGWEPKVKLRDSLQELYGWIETRLNKISP